MAEIRVHAGRVLRQRTLSDGTRRGLRGYFAITHGERPSWWTDESFDGSAVGVFENVSGSGEDAIVIDAGGITVLSHPRQRLEFAEVATLTPPPKQPVPKAIECRMKDGTTFALPVLRQDGSIMDIYRFLLSAVRERRVRRD